MRESEQAMDSIEMFHWNSSVCGHEHFPCTYSVLLLGIENLGLNYQMQATQQPLSLYSQVIFRMCISLIFVISNALHAWHCAWIMDKIVCRTLRVLPLASKCIHSAVHIETNDQ